ncbi:WD40 repeat - like 10 [Theobroma cacao]|uniref:U3 snoRNP-associated protein-like EMB2271 isoform X2 n=2 Tax=Theobroma cacao TaxID=3641 RepID=A0AB32UZ19_THECC|nr:PREDICTED: U3 snoRNP-associated protein-like EMB2271 isoform X2 [Theobroma cacao]EOY25478.1 Transducin/WD40 repeat-like superfamily protein, putative isoform 1 [Theobroma cacao]WRX26351.1 WD40 repeat - like 10 [Theobroma cacao]
MKSKNENKRVSAPKGGQKGGKFSMNNGPFFEAESKKRRKTEYEDDDIESGDSEEEAEILGGFDASGGVEEDEDDVETPGEIRKRVATELLDKMRAIARKEKEDEDEDWEEGEEARDSVVAKILQQEQLEESGRARRVLASRLKKPETTDGFKVLVKHQQSVTAVALSDDDLKGFSASKDGTILQWDVESGKSAKYQWPSEDILKSHGAKDPRGRVKKHSRNVLALAVSSDGRYLASGGLDRHVHLWDIRTREHLQAFPGHQKPVSCLSFRQGTADLFSGSFDRTVKYWNMEDRAYIDTIYGHESEVLTLDCLRKERVLTVGRDRCMMLFKVLDQSRLVFRPPPSSLECCCFVNNDEFLSGSDDGSIELWSIGRKKPVYIVKNAHALLPACQNVEQKGSEKIPNIRLENGDHKIESYSSSSTYSWVSSITVCRGSDLAASGAGNGCIQLWAIESGRKDIQPLYGIPLVGFVNSLAFANSGQFLIAGVGQEPRLGRWGRHPTARNGVAIQSLKLL